MDLAHFAKVSGWQGTRMTFRRDLDNSACGSQWRLANHSLLVECGIPYEVADSDRRWGYVLLHGADDFGTGWNPSWITKAQAAQLLTAIETALPNSVGYELIGALRARST